MAHQSLYRKYRPQKFSEVVGQQEVVGPLEEQIKNGNIGHAYLFAGSRGLGKTSIARIFAREVGAKERDLYELDAASNNGVDEIRSLNESVYTLPFESPYKVYILDEAHMLSKNAWNAFLKTLEEPPAHAIFILATTELDKVPETVQSRCQVFEFKKPSRKNLHEMVVEILKKEGKNNKEPIKPDAADLIALLADGSYRDALSILEKILAAPGGNRMTITLEDVEFATGAPKRALVHTLVLGLHEGKADKAIVAIRTAANAGVDMKLFLVLTLEYLRAVLLVRHAPELRKELAEELGVDEYEEVEKLALVSGGKLNHQTLKVFLDCASRMRFSPVPALPLELAVLELTGQD